MKLPLETTKSTTCPHCGKAFGCQASLGVSCPCFQVQLSEDIREFLAQKYLNQCLCNDCLVALGGVLISSTDI